MFDTSTVNAQQGRIALLVEAALPILVFLLLSWVFPMKKHPRVEGLMFRVLWFLMIAAWVIGLVVTALDETSIVTMSLVGSFSIVALIACWWATSSFSKGDPSDGAKMITLAALMMGLCTIAAVTGEAPNDSLTMSSIFYAFVAGTLATGVVLVHADLGKAKTHM